MVRNRKTGRRGEPFVRRVLENSRRLMRAIRSQTDHRRNGTDVISMVICKSAEFGVRSAECAVRTRPASLGKQN